VQSHDWRWKNMDEIINDAMDITIKAVGGIDVLQRIIIDNLDYLHREKMLSSDKMGKVQELNDQLRNIILEFKSVLVSHIFETGKEKE
jgi:hypothetical protein